MTINEWKELYRILDDQHSEFLLQYPQSKNGKNKKIREAASTKAYNCIDLCCNWILRHPEAYELIAPNEQSDYGRAIVWDEFKRARYFGNDMTKFLEKVKAKIESLEEEK